VVKKVTEKSNGKTYAVKLFDKAARTANVRSIVNEVELVVKLKGAPHCAPLPFLLRCSYNTINEENFGIGIVIKDIYEDKETLYLVMDQYVFSEPFPCSIVLSFTFVWFRCKCDLLEEISRVQFFEEKDARQIIRSLAKAVAYLHSKSIVHSDIRVLHVIPFGFCLLSFDFFSFQPEKVLCGLDFAQNKASVYLSDFGAAKLLEEGQMLSKSAGAISYLCMRLPFDCGNLDLTIL